MPAVAAFDRWFILINKTVLVLLMMSMTVLVFGNVVGRYGFGVSYGWAEELSRFAMIWTAFLGIGLALRYGQLAAVEMLHFMVPARAARLLRLVVAAAMAAFLLAVLILGAQFAAFSWELRTPVLQWPRGIPYLAVPVGAALALVHLGICLPRFLAGQVIELEDPDIDDPPPGGGSGQVPPGTATNA